MGGAQHGPAELEEASVVACSGKDADHWLGSVEVAEIEVEAGDALLLLVV